MKQLLLAMICTVLMFAISPAARAQAAQTPCEIEEAKANALSAWRLYEQASGKPQPPLPHPDTNIKPDAGLVGLRKFVSAYPQHICIDRYRTTLTNREAKIAKFAADGSTTSREAKLLPNVRIVGDYPDRAMRNQQTGRVGVELFIEADGMVESCRMTNSSGVSDLDSETCRSYMRRGKYDPARDAKGKPISSNLPQSLNWQL